MSLKPNAILHANPDPVRLRRLITQAGYTQPEIALLAGVNVRTVQRALAGDGSVSYPLQFTIEAICATRKPRSR